MLRVPKGKAPEGLPQAKIDAFDSLKDSYDSYDGYGRSIASDKRSP